MKKGIKTMVSRIDENLKATTVDELEARIKELEDDVTYLRRWNLIHGFMFVLVTAGMVFHAFAH